MELRTKALQFVASDDFKTMNIHSTMELGAHGMERFLSTRVTPELPPNQSIIRTRQSRIFFSPPGLCLFVRCKSLRKLEFSGFRLLNRRSTSLLCSSIDDEFRSSRNIALSLLKRYKKVVEKGFSNNIKDFITAGVTAYAIGCTDEGLRRELLSVKDSVEDMEISSGGGTGVKIKITLEEIEECILWLSIIFITILCTPQPTVVRWSKTTPVSDEAESTWRGFCALIANAYYMRGMAWLPVKTLQLEQMAVTGHADPPSLVADRMRIVFATLENVSPQWPKG